METRGANTLLTTLLYASQAKENKNLSNLTQDNKRQQSSFASKDIVSLSADASPLASTRTKLISDITEQLENGYRRTQEFERADGKNFTRIEEFTTTENRAKRFVIQQNVSGSTSLLEDIFDRQKNGSFRLTQRYTNEVGETSVNIDPNAKPPSPDIILGRAPSGSAPLNEANVRRGSELDLVT